jgi:hypothetical protein
MSETISIPSFNELLEVLNNGSINQTDDKIQIGETVLSSEEFDKLYLADIKDLFSQYETKIFSKTEPEFDMLKQFNLTGFLNPVLKSTNAQEVAKSFQKKISTAILDNYGHKLSGEKVLEFADNDLVEPENVITMLKCKSLYAQDSKSSDYVKPVSYSELLDFYSPKKHPNRIANLQKNNKITLEFQEFYKEMLETVSEQERKEYIEALIQEAKDDTNSTSQEFSENILGYANNQIIPDEELEKNISGEFLLKQYLDKKISIARVLEIYQTAPEHFSAVKSILTPDKIQDDTKFSSIMYLFLHCDILSITELKNLLVETKNTESLDGYIDEGSSPSKIKELYENYLIDYACIKNLQSIGILKEKDIQKYHFSIKKDDCYKELDNLQDVTIIGTGNTVPFSNTGFFMQKQKVQSNPELNVYEILGKDNDKSFSELPTIHHIDEHKENGFLNNYKIITLKFSGLVAFVSNDKTKPIYIMPYQEAIYIIKNHKLPEHFSKNEQIKDVRSSENRNEEILKTASTFDVAKDYLENAGYNEKLDYDSNYKNMSAYYNKILLRGI